jgi:5-bromo-4-chloroindolyl phosphate hydrolysis protein
MKKFIFSSLIGFFLITPFWVWAIEIRPPGIATMGGIIDLIIKICLTVALPLAIITVLVAAFMILRSQGELQKVSQGKKILTYGLIGLAAVIVASGSGTILKNIFKVELPETFPETFEEKLARISSQPLFPSPEKIESGLRDIEGEMALFQRQLEEAREKGDTEAANILERKISQLELERKSLASLEEASNRFKKALGFSPQMLEMMVDSPEGLEFLAKYGIKDEKGWYLLEGGGKYNPQTKEYIDSTGKVYTETRLMDDGTVMYCP